MILVRWSEASQTGLGERMAWVATVEPFGGFLSARQRAAGGVDPVLVSLPRRLRYRS
jgi:hypothetical protein